MANFKPRLLTPALSPVEAERAMLGGSTRPLAAKFPG